VFVFVVLGVISSVPTYWISNKMSYFMLSEMSNLTYSCTLWVCFCIKDKL